MFKTHYVGHDEAYRKLRAAGHVGWDKTEDAYSERFEQLTRVLTGGLAPRRGRLLELGCGAGNVTLWLAGLGYEVTGVDIAPTAITWAKQKAEEAGVQATFLEGDVLNLYTLGANSFDLVLDGHCLHCIIGADRARLLVEVYRILKPGGYFLVDTMCGPVTPGRLQGYDETSRCTLFGDVATRHFGLPEDILKEVVDAGFQVLTSRLESEESHGMLSLELRR